MFTNTKDLEGLVIRATDGEIGTVRHLYFDDHSWAVRYLTVETGGWLGGRQVLVSPISIISADWQANRLNVALTRKQVENSPNIDTHRPVSRQDEIEYLGYYKYAPYWGGPNMWGSDYYPGRLAVPMPSTAQEAAAKIQRAAVDSHLRSTDDVTGYHIEATDGEIGHLEQFVIDDKAWAIRYLEVATQNWWPGKKVLFSPAWVERVSWMDSKVFVALSREAIQQCPEYLETKPITREYEDRLHRHYGRPPYWLNEGKHEAVLALAGA